MSDALRVGYRMIDTAQAYHNEGSVGNAVKKSGIDHKDIFLVCKVKCGFPITATRRRRLPKIVVSFCTYASTYRNEPLTEIVNNTPDADHLTGEVLTSGCITPEIIRTWIDLINKE